MRIALVLIFLFLGCNQETSYVPPLQDEQIIEMLTDMHTAEAALSRVSIEKVDSNRNIYLKQIFKKYHMNATDHEQLMDYLKKDPQRLSELYQIVFDSIEAKGARLEPKI